ncbi:MAG: c-type cytochrome, partial [Myxococcales bacterium]|nr:c-type cytochrome [Myxococcales bacterium]
ETATGAEKVDVIDVGAEPYGIVADEAGTRVYVAVSQANEVVEIDARTGDVLRTWSVPHEPRYLALHPKGETLFVATGRAAAHVYQLDVSDGAVPNSRGEEPTSIDLPGVNRLDEQFQWVGLTARVTGDIAVSADGEELVVPVTYVDNINPVGDVEVDPEGQPVAPATDGYGGAMEGVNRFNPGLVVVPVDGGEADADGAEAIFVSGMVSSDARLDADLASDSAFPFEPGFGMIRSYPSSVTISPDGTTYVVTFQGSGAIALVGRLPFSNKDGIRGGGADIAMPFPGDTGGGGLPFTVAEEAGFSSRPKAFVDMPAHNPTGVVFLDSTNAWVHAADDRVVADIAFDDAFDDLRRNGTNGFDDISFRQIRDLSNELAPQVLPADVFEGRKLFFSATNPGMVASGAGVSCASCHFEGRNDGLTWTFASGPRQTPSLAGEVSRTAPVTWTSDVPSVAHEARITTQARMGGMGLADTELDKIAAYVDWTRLADTPMRGSDDPAIARGKALFERQDVGCASCHNGEAFTDNQSWSMFGLTNVNTPTLAGIAGSGPYLHDGRASTLRDVLLFARTGEMGDTSMLSDAELDDLEAYLESL